MLEFLSVNVLAVLSTALYSLNGFVSSANQCNKLRGASCCLYRYIFYRTFNLICYVFMRATLFKSGTSGRGAARAVFGRPSTAAQGYQVSQHIRTNRLATCETTVTLGPLTIPALIFSANQYEFTITACINVFIEIYMCAKTCEPITGGGKN